MAHTCPACGMTCYCNGDIDEDKSLGLVGDILACMHCVDDEDENEKE